MAELAIQVNMSAFREALLEVFGTEGQDHEVRWENVGGGNHWGKLDGRPITILTGDDPAEYRQRLLEYKASIERARAGGKTGGAVS